MNRKDITIIILVLIIIGIAGYYGYNYLQDKFYNEGMRDGAELVVQTQTQNEQIFLIVNGNITSFPLNQLCGGES